MPGEESTNPNKEGKYGPYKKAHHPRRSYRGREKTTPAHLETGGKEDRRKSHRVNTPPRGRSEISRKLDRRTVRNYIWNPERDFNQTNHDRISTLPTEQT